MNEAATVSDDEDDVFICYGDAEPGDKHLLARVVVVDEGIIAWLARRERRRAGQSKRAQRSLP